MLHSAINNAQHNYNLPIMLSIMSLSIMTSSITMNSTMTLSIMTLGIKGFYVTFSINNAQHNNALPLCWILPFIYYYAECKYTECQYGRCHYAECQYAECRGTIYKSLSSLGSGACSVKLFGVMFKWCHDSKHNNTQHNNIEQNDTQLKGLMCDTA